VQNHDCQEKKKRATGIESTVNENSDDSIGDTTYGKKRSIELMKRAKYGIFGPISREDRQHHGTDEPERVRVPEVDHGTEASTAEARVADHLCLRRDLRHRRIRQRGHLHRHQAKSSHANRYQLLSVQSSDIRLASLDSR